LHQDGISLYFKLIVSVSLMRRTRKLNACSGLKKLSTLSYFSHERSLFKPAVFACLNVTYMQFISNVFCQQVAIFQWFFIIYYFFTNM